MDSREEDNLPADHNHDSNLYRSFNASTSSSSSSFNSSPPDFLRNVQAAFKRHRMMPRMNLNNFQPRRLVAHRQETSNSSSPILDSKTDESHHVSAKPLAKNMMTLTTYNHESASVTPPSISGTPTEEGKFKSIDAQRCQPSINCDCKNRNSFDLPCLQCKQVVPVDAPKKVQFALENDARSHMGSLALTEMECDTNNQLNAPAVLNHDPNLQNVHNLDSDLTSRPNDERNFLQSDFGHHMTSSSNLGSTCCATTLVNSVHAPMVNSTTHSCPENKCELPRNQQGKETGSSSSSMLKDPPPVSDKSTKGDPLSVDAIDLKNDVKSASLKSGKQEKPASKKDSSAPRKRNYDPDLFFKVNGKLYQRLGKIGSGGSSEVHKVISQDCTIYALKKIKLKGRDYATAYGFCQEIEYLNKLKGKDHIIQLIDYEVTDKALLKEVMSGCMSNKDGRVKEDGCIYMVLEYGEIDLAHMLSHKWRELDTSSSTIDENWLRFYWQQILLAVKTIHEERIVHSDLKPANFLLVRGSLKLIDFGIAKAILSDTTNIQRDSQVGTLSYMSPEAFMCNETDANGNTIKCGRPSDIWSLGCILYQMVYGKTPFADYTTFWAKFKVITDPNHEIHYQPPPPNPWLLDLIKKCLAWDRKQRWTIPQLLQHPFLVPPIPVPVSDRNLIQLVSDSCREDRNAMLMCSRLQELVTDPIGLGSVDEKCKLLDEMSRLCIQLKELLGKPESN
ncbi:unnamed protein product [Lactuca virosa]|uniref:Protein kinase domain-containing protein n=1 Tax=Lactuca virosa TaxID=75947 RepID=A0AAU9PXK2_9ASTR|nr:unnamed protein product [Lactuca virosa]